MAIAAQEEASPIINDFLRYESLNLSHSDMTVKEYFLDLRTFFRFMKRERAAVPPDMPFEEIPIDDIDLDFIRGISKIDINNFVEFLRCERSTAECKDSDSPGVSAATVQRKIACLKSFFGFYCNRKEAINKDPTVGVVVPRLRKHLPEYYTQDESFRLLSAVTGLNEARDYCILILFLTCGVRVSEIVSINIPDLRFDAGQKFLTITGKGNKQRQVYLSDACIEAIDDYLEIREDTYKPNAKSKDALFLSRKHSRLSVDAVQDLVRKATLQAGLRPYSPHKLRHTAATLMLANGVDVRTIQEVLGHSSLSTTQIYTHVNADQLRVATRANPISRARKKSRGKNGLEE